jgi:hypothetical protein
VATVTNGIVTAVGAGPTTITATVGSVTTGVPVTVGTGPLAFRWRSVTLPQVGTWSRDTSATLQTGLYLGVAFQDSAGRVTARGSIVLTRP